MLETVRRRLRGLVKLIEYKKRTLVYSDFEDSAGAATDITVPGIAVGTDMDAFRRKARLFLKPHENHIAVLKVKRNAAGEYLRKHHAALFQNDKLRRHFNEGLFNGFDFDPTMLRIGSMNMALHGVEGANVSYRDSLAEDHAEDAGRYSLVLANPPFAGALDYEATAKDLQRIVKPMQNESKRCTVRCALNRFRASIMDWSDIAERAYLNSRGLG
jgi:hypothetical protein